MLMVNMMLHMSILSDTFKEYIVLVKKWMNIQGLIYNLWNKIGNSL